MTTLPESLATAALLGTARSTLDLDDLRTAVEARRSTEDPAARLLTAAALESSFLAGATATVMRPRPAPAPEDDRPVLPGAAAERLRALLAVRSPLLDEWFSTAEKFRAAHDIVVDLLDLALTDTAHRDRLLDLAGERGRWLAARSPEWRDLLPPDPTDATDWNDGRPARRRRWFGTFRAQDPEAAVTFLSTVWAGLGAAHRTELLELLRPDLGPQDEPFLERALDDRSRKVREVAVDLLAELPESEFALRMAHRAQHWSVEGPDGSVLTVPNRTDAAAHRDGFTDGNPARSVELLVSAAPLSVWGTELPAVGGDDPIRAVIDRAWSTAVARQRDTTRAAALLRRDDTVDAAVARILPREILIEHLRARPVDTVLDDVLLAALPAPWPLDLAEKILAALYRAVSTTPAVRGIVTLLAHRAPFELADLLTDAANRTDDLGRLHVFASAADDLTLRKTIHEELS